MKKNFLLFIMFIFLTSCVEEVPPIEEDLANNENNVTKPIPTPTPEEEAPPTPEVTKLVISNVTFAEVKETSAIIKWNTNIPASGQVEYGKNSASGLVSRKDNTLKTSHQHILENLSSDQNYLFKVRSENLNQNMVSSDYSFKTVKPAPLPTPEEPVIPDPTPVVISNMVQSISHNEALIAVQTDIDASLKIEYRENVSAVMTQIENGYKKSFFINLRNLKPETQYHYQVVASTNKNKTTKSSAVSFVTKKAPVILQPKAPIISKVDLVGENYQIVFSHPSDALSVDGGFDTFVDKVDQNDHQNYSGFTRSISGLDTSVQHCFSLESRYVELNTFLSSNEVCVAGVAPELTANAPVLNDVVKKDSNYELSFSLPKDSLMPAGGFDTFINDEDQNDNGQYQGLTRTITNLDTTIKQCFSLESRYTSLDPKQFLRSNEVCIDGVAPPPSSGDTITLTRLKAFPSAEGHGADIIKGGRGGKIFYVDDLGNNINGSYDSKTGTHTGSFRYALNHSDPGYIVFRTAGVAFSGGKSDYMISSSKAGHKTILGATAPYPGVIVYGHSFRINASTENHWVIRGLTLLGGKNMRAGEDDTFLGFGVKKFVLADNTIGWGGDEACSIVDSDDFIMQKNLLIEGHPRHNVGSILNTDHEVAGTRNGSAHNNVYVHVRHRFPNTSGLKTDTIEVVNNVAYNFGSRLTNHKLELNLNVINNYYKAGPDSSSSPTQKWNADAMNSPFYDPPPQIYSEGNIVTNIHPDPNKNDHYMWVQHISANGFKSGTKLTSDFFTSKRHPLGVDIKPKTAKQAYEYNVKGKNVGSRFYMASDGTRKKYYQPFIEAYLDDAINGTKKAQLNDNNKYVLPSIPSSRSPYVDSDKDGMPDEWEKEHGLNVGEQDHNKVKGVWEIDGATFVNQAGYTNMEIFGEYAHGGFQALIDR